jgi:hypothetical protein
MRSPAKRVMYEYTTLMVKMGFDMIPGPGQRSNAGAGDNFDYLVHIEVLLSLACFIPQLDAVHYLIKLSQARDIFICDLCKQSSCARKSWPGSLSMEPQLIADPTISNTMHLPQ